MKKQQKDKDAKHVHEPEVMVQELIADLKRVQADFINFRRRAEEQAANIKQQGRRGVILKLLPTIDNLRLALNHQPKELINDKWAQGITGVAKQLDRALHELGVQKIESVGKVFDPNLHEAVHVEGGDGKHEIVTEELQSGYKLDDEVIRHAMVKVGRANNLSKKER